MPICDSLPPGLRHCQPASPPVHRRSNHAKSQLYAVEMTKNFSSGSKLCEIKKPGLYWYALTNCCCTSSFFLIREMLCWSVLMCACLDQHTWVHRLLVWQPFQWEVLTLALSPPVLSFRSNYLGWESVCMSTQDRDCGRKKHNLGLTISAYNTEHFFFKCVITEQQLHWRVAGVTVTSPQKLRNRDANKNVVWIEV